MEFSTRRHFAGRQQSTYRRDERSTRDSPSLSRSHQVILVSRMQTSYQQLVPGQEQLATTHLP